MNCVKPACLPGCVKMFNTTGSHRQTENDSKNRGKPGRCCGDTCFFREHFIFVSTEFLP